MTDPELAAIVVSWRAAADVAELASAWPRDGRFELVVVDQTGDLGEIAGARVLRPGENLGFAGGSNLGAKSTAAPILLFLNPDTRPEAGALDAIARAFERWPQAAGVVPRLVGFDGAAQTTWQLRRLPSPAALLAQAFFFTPGRFAGEPAEGSTIEQPAAAALALRRELFESVGGFDDRFFPAWFEDVDLARRLADAGHRLFYLPRAVIQHRQGSSVASLGYGSFLQAYDRNLLRYLDKHHGHLWSVAFRWAAAVGAIVRLLALPLRRPARAASRAEAAAALLAVAFGAATGWRQGS